MVKKASKTPLSIFMLFTSSSGPQNHMIVVNSGQEDELEVWGYKVDLLKYALTIIGIVCSFGLLGLPLYWWKHLWLQFTRVKCSLKEATSVLVVVS